MTKDKYREMVGLKRRPRNAWFKQCYGPNDKVHKCPNCGVPKYEVWNCTFCKQKGEKNE